MYVCALQSPIPFHQSSIPICDKGCASLDVKSRTACFIAVICHLCACSLSNIFPPNSFIYENVFLVPELYHLSLGEGSFSPAFICLLLLVL